MTQLPPRNRLLLVVLTALAVTAAAVIAGCGSSDSPSSSDSVSPVKTAIVKFLPRDATVEPPWNGRFVQVNVRVADPGGMDPTDWHVSVNGKEPKLEKAANILPFSSTQAVVAFMFQTPYVDLGTYDFKVTYAPKDGKRVQLAWQYKW